MIRKINHQNMGKGETDWLTSWFHFSFAEYYNPQNMQYGMLRVVNDDLIQPKSGFRKHPHANMEIITYVINGELTHGDNLNNLQTLHRGEVQYMCAGTGILHSEFNKGDEALRLLQIWIFPDQMGYTPHYQDYSLNWEERRNQWLHIVSGEQNAAPICIHQDVNIFVAELTDEQTLEFAVKEGRQVYLISIEGTAHVNNVILRERDAAAINGESIFIQAQPSAHIMLFEMKKLDEQEKQ